MPVYLLTDKLVFPPAEGASREGVVAVGGDFRPERLLLAYSQGIFPWPTEGMPLLWFSPDPRFVLRPREVHVGRSLKKAMRREPFEVRFDTAFEGVIRACGLVPRPGQDGTWIQEDLIEGYLALHRLGFAHSIEAWRDDALVGGLYGVSLGSCFFGESMFAVEPDASKVAFVTLLAHLERWGIGLVDCQVKTEHLSRFGGREVSRRDFLAELRTRLTHETRRGTWRTELGSREALDALEAPHGAGH
ncbi:MAG: leucyl/phenylalanyl-tRNA--protein transferase [Sandaracinaceae bacterium]|nr:leucyl/phenylalanyl-tRNA--protein transferase [Sandaracinaceae bacterium]